jgi:hypothetical protein
MSVAEAIVTNNRRVEDETGKETSYDDSRGQKYTI